MSKLETAIENSDNQITAPIPQPEPEAVIEVGDVNENAAETEAATAEVTEQSGEIEEFAEAASDAQDDTQTLDSIQNALTDATQTEEGVEPATLEIAKIAVEAIYVRLGMTAKRALPSLEGLTEKNDLNMAAKVAVESIGESVKKIWEAIVRTFELIIKKIKEFYGAFVQSREALLKRVQAVKKAAQDASGKTAPADFKLSDRTLTTVHVKGTCDLQAAEDYFSSCILLMDMSEELSNFNDKLCQIFEGNDSKKVSDTDFDDAFKKGNEIFANFVAQFPSRDKRTEAHLGYFYSGLTLHYDKVKVKAEFVQGDEKKPEKGDVLAPADVVKLMTKAETIVKDLAEFDAISSKQRELSEKTRKFVEQLLKGTEGNFPSSSSKLKDLARDIQGIATLVSTTSPSIVYKSVKAVVDYADESIKALTDAAKP